MTRPQHALLALALAVPAAFGLALAATGVAHLVGGRFGSGAVLVTAGAALVFGAFRWLRRINARA